MDGTEKVEDGVVDETAQSPQDEAQNSQKQSPKTDKGSPKEPQLTPELEKMVEKLAHDRYTAKLAKDGDRLKALEEKFAKVEEERQQLQEERLADTASRYGLTLEQVKEAGIEGPSKVEALAKLFGKAGGETVKPPRVDSGQTSGGGGELTAEKVRNMTPEERHARRAEIAKLPLGI